MNKKAFLIVFLFCLAVSLYSLDGVFTGLSAEINAHTRRGTAIGGGLLLGFDLNPDYSAGLKAAFYHNLATVSCVESQAMFRYYLPWSWSSMPFGLEGGIFVQAEAGCVVFFEYGETFPAFSGGLAAGWRINFGKNWFLEPALRGGYPYMWGLGLTTGPRFSMNSKKTYGKTK